MQKKILNTFVFETDSGNKYVFDNASGVVVPHNEAINYIIEKYFTFDKEILLNEIIQKFDISEQDAQINYRYVELKIKNGFFYKDSILVDSLKNVDKEYINKIPFSQMVLIVTEDCNIRCKYCIYSDNYPHMKTYSSTSMSFDIAKQALDYYIKLHKERERNGLTKDPAISFFGGEPFMQYKLIKDVVEYCKLNDFNANFFITTNGTIMNEEITDLIINNNVYVTFSLDGNKENHNRNRVFANNRGSFDLVIQNITQLQNEKAKNNIIQPIMFNCCYDNYTDLCDVFNFFEQNNNLFEPYYLMFSQIFKYNTSYYESESVKEEYEQKDKNALSKSLKIIKDHFIDNSIKGVRNSNNLITMFLPYYNIHHRNKGYSDVFNGSCTTGSKIAVDPKGEFYVCDRMCQSHSIGNIKTGIDINKINQIREKFFLAIKETCIECPLNRLCNICYMHLNKNDSFEFNKELCEDSRALNIELLKTVYSILEINPDAFNMLPENISIEFYNK